MQQQLDDLRVPSTRSPDDRINAVLLRETRVEEVNNNNNMFLFVFTTSLSECT